jgi:NTE family protein
MTIRLPISLALAGGGLSGALYDFGAVCGLEAGLPNWRAVHSERIVGTSAGAVVGAILAFGMDAAQASAGFRNGARGGLRFGRRDFYGIPWRERGAVLSGAFTNAGLERFVERAAVMAGCPDRFDALKAPLLIPATDLDSGERVVFGPDCPDLPKVSLAVRASSAIPATFRPVDIDGRAFIDGQLLDPLHLDLSVGPETRAVFAVSSLVPYRWPGRGRRVSAMHFPAILDQAARVSAVAKLAPSLAAFKQRHPDVALFMIEPQPEEVNHLITTGFSRASLNQAWSLGFQAAERLIDAQKSELEILVGPVTKGAPRAHFDPR